MDYKEQTENLLYDAKDWSGDPHIKKTCLVRRSPSPTCWPAQRRRRLPGDLMAVCR